MADTGDDLLDGDGLLAETGDFDEDLDGDAEDALLADDSSYGDHYNLRTVPTSGRDVYIESKHSATANKVSIRSSAAETIYHEVEDVVEGDEIIDDDEEDVLDLGVTDEFENELQDHPHNSSAGSGWIKQERVDKENLSSLAISNRLHSVHRVDSHNSGAKIKQEPPDVDTTEGNNVNQQPSVVVTSSTEVLQQKYQSSINESDEDDNNNDEESRDRFKTERTNVISLKTSGNNKWGEIPDSLDSVVTQQLNQQRGGMVNRGGGIGGGARRGRPPQLPQLHPPSHKIHINPHFKKTADQHLHPVHPSPWENQVPLQHQPTYESPVMHHNPPTPQHYGPLHPPPQVQPPPVHQAQPQPMPPGPPQMYHQQSAPPLEPVHSQPPHLPQPQNMPAPWMRNERPPPPAQPHFDPQYGGVPQQQYYQQRGPPPPSNAIYPHQQPPYEQNVVQHHHSHAPPPHPHHQPGYEYQQMPPPQHLVQPPPPGEESLVQCNPVRTVQFSRDSQQITVQMTGNQEIPSHYNSNQQFNTDIRPMHPHHQDNTWINRGMAPPGPQQHHRPPYFIQPGQRLPPSPQQPPQLMQGPRGQHPRFMRGSNFRRGVINRHPHPRHPHPQLQQSDMQHVGHMGGPSGDGPFVGPPGAGIGKRLGDIHQSPIVPFKQARFSNPNNINVQQPVQVQRKGPVMSNLCEVPTVDNVPDTTTRLEQPLEDEDEETREYRLKIAEQKRLREKFLLQKEMRRQLAAVKKQQEIKQKLVSDPPLQQFNNNLNNNNIPVLGDGQQQLQHQQQQPLENHHQMNAQRLSVHQRIGGKVIVPVQVGNPMQGSPITGYKIVRVRAKDGSILIKKMPVRKDMQFGVQQGSRPQVQFPQQQVMHHQNQHQQYQHNQQVGSYIVPTLNRRVVVDSVVPHKQQILARGSFHAARKKAMKKNMTPVTTIVPTKPATHSMTLGQRFSMQASQQQQQQIDSKVGVLSNNQQQQQQLPQSTVGRSNRKVVSSGSAHTGNIKVTAAPPGPVGHTVIVDNLTASTSKEQLTKMARQVGEVEKMNLEPQLKRATITFKNTNSASAFYLKFQRKMVDLSMINVSVVPE